MSELTEEVAIRLPWRNYSIIDLKIRQQSKMISREVRNNRIVVRVGLQQNTSRII